MRLIHKTLKSLRKPMVASSLLALRVHSLLNNGPAAIVGDDKGMKIELEASTTAALSTLATSRLVLANSAPSKPTFSPIKASSGGVCRENRPRPPHTWMPSSSCSGARPRFKAPITLVVIPDECQSMPMTAPNDWNQKG